MNSIGDEFPGRASCGDQGASVELAYFGDLSMTNLPAVGQFHIDCSLYRVVGGPLSGAQWPGIFAATEDVQNDLVELDREITAGRKKRL
jgi:hypothetical protein